MINLELFFSTSLPVRACILLQFPDGKSRKVP